MTPQTISHFAILILGILKALVRDGLRCIITGDYDFRVLIPEVKEEADKYGLAASSTACVHIFPQPIGQISGIDGEDAKVRIADLSSAAINHVYL